MTTTKDQKYVVINVHSKESSEVYVLDAADPAARPECLHSRQKGVEFFVDHGDQGFFVITNANTVRVHSACIICLERELVYGS